MRVRNVICAVGSCALVLSGCGSQVPPKQFYGGGVQAQAQAPSGAPQTGTTSGAADVLDGGSTIPGSPGATLSTGSTGTAGHPGSGTTKTSTPPASAGITAGSCAGFTNTTGITNSTIDLGNVADLTGPVPGLFTSAQQAVLAYESYFNSTSSICGRKLKVISYDSQTSATGDLEADTTACDNTFAMVGSIGAFDNGGVNETTKCGLPDLRTIATNPQRADAPTSFGVDAAGPDQVSESQYSIIKSLTGTASAKSAMLYLNAGAAVPNALAYEQTMTHLGYHFVYTQAIGVTEFNYAPYVAQMKSLGVTLVQFEGDASYAERLKQEMTSQGLDPVFVMDSVAYDPTFVQAGGSDINGMYSYVDTSLLEEESKSPELQLYNAWLQRVAPGTEPTFYGMFAWGAMALFTQLAIQLGGKLTRASLLTAIKGVHDFSDHGLFAPQNIGSKQSSPCQAVIQLESGKWVRRSPYPYSCDGVFNAVTS